MSLVTSLLGRKPIREFTAVGAVPTIDGGSAVPIPATKGQKKKKRRYVKEDDLIPSDAEQIDGESETGTTDDQVDVEHSEGTEDETQQLLDPSMALVVPDSTPNWDVPLSPTRAPVSTTPTKQAAVKQNAETSMSVSAMQKLSRSNKEEPQRAPAEVDAQAESFVSSVVSSAPVIPLTEEELIGQGRPMPAPSAPSSTGSKSMLNRFSFRK